MVGKYQRNCYKSSKPDMRSFSSKNFYGETRPTKSCSSPLKEGTAMVFVTFKKDAPAVLRHELWNFFLSQFGDVVQSIRMDPLSPPWYAWVRLYTPEMVERVLGAHQGEVLPRKFMYNGKSIWIKRSTF